LAEGSATVTDLPGRGGGLRPATAGPVLSVSPISVTWRAAVWTGDVDWSRFRVLSDEQWERIEPLLPSNAGRRGHPFGDVRKVVEGIVYRYRTGISWRDLPREVFGPWQTVWKRHRRYAGDGIWDRVLGRLLAEADAAGKVDWRVSVAATITRAHQHATNTTRPEQDTGAVSNYKNLPLAECEPAGHGIGRSRGG
jgi:transposase